MTAEQVLNFIVEVLAVGGGAAAVAYLLFQHLGKSWLDSKFHERLETVRQQHALELQRLHVEIESLLSGSIKLQEKEFAVLPEVWAKLDEAHGLVTWLCSPFQSYADVDRMNDKELDEFLADSEFYESQKERIKGSYEKGKTYQEILFRHRAHRVGKAISDLQNYVARNGIFLQTGLKDKFTKIIQILHEAKVSKQVGTEAQDWKMQSKGWEQLKEQSDPLYKSIENDIQARLQAHGKK
jgi:hypothetical protein